MFGKPVYGMIGATGQRWVVYDAEDDGQGGWFRYGSRIGYGEFPYDEYQDIPVVDLTGMEDLAIRSALGSDRPKNYKPTCRKELDGIIQWFKDNGAIIRINGIPTFDTIPKDDLVVVTCAYCGQEYYYDAWNGNYYTSDGEPFKPPMHEAIYEADIDLCSEECYDDWVYDNSRIGKEP